MKERERARKAQQNKETYASSRTVNMSFVQFVYAHSNETLFCVFLSIVTMQKKTPLEQHTVAPLLVVTVVMTSMHCHL